MCRIYAINKTLLLAHLIHLPKWLTRQNIVLIQKYIFFMAKIKENFYVLNITLNQYSILRSILLLF